MQITYEGRDYQFDQQKISVDEWRELKRKYRMTPKGFGEGIDEADPDAMTFLYWVLLRQNSLDRGQPLGDHLKPDLIKLNNATDLAVKAEAEAAAEAEAEPDPTSPSPSPSPSPPVSLLPPAPPSPAPNPNGQTEVTTATTES